MQWFLTGLGYGVMALGWLFSFTGGLIVLMSVCAFMSWLGDKVSGEDGDAGEEQRDE